MEAVPKGDPLLAIFRLSEIPYVPTVISGPDPLLFITLDVLGRQVTALVDKGSSRNFIGPVGVRLGQELKLPMIESCGKVQFANSQLKTVSQEILIPVKVCGTVRQISTRVLDSLPFALVLGLDFLRVFGITRCLGGGVKTPLSELTASRWKLGRVIDVAELQN